MVGIQFTGEAGEKIKRVIFNFLKSVLSQRTYGGIMKSDIQCFCKVLGMEGVQNFLFGLAGSAFNIRYLVKGLRVLI